MTHDDEAAQEILDRLLIMGRPVHSKHAEHFMTCAHCRKPFDMRDLGEVFFHEHAEQRFDRSVAANVTVQS